MGRLATFFVIVFVTGIISPSMLMLSIEKDTIYVESFDLVHITESTTAPPAGNFVAEGTGFGSGRVMGHRHLQLVHHTILEKRTASPGTPVISDIDILSAYRAFSGFPETGHLQHQLTLDTQVTLPIAPLLQAAVLLI
jgi:hypothetical protein